LKVGADTLGTEEVNEGFKETENGGT